MASISTAHTATGVGLQIRVPYEKSHSYTITGTFVGTWVIEYSKDDINWIQLATGTGTQTIITTINDQTGKDAINIRSNCTAFTSGTLTAVVADVTDALPEHDIVAPDGTVLFSVDEAGVSFGGDLDVTGDTTSAESSTFTRTAQKKLLTSGAKVGAGAGAVIDAANDKGSLFKVPQSQTASTVVIKIPDLKVGDTITAIGILGQIESAANTVTVDLILMAQTAVAAGNTDAAIGSGITQISKTADYKIDDSETGLTEVVDAGKAYYLLATVTTGATTDVDVLSTFVTVTEA